MEVIIRKVKVNRTLTGHEAIHATNRRELLEDEVVSAMPNGTENEIEIHFVHLKGSVAAKNLEAELDKLGYKLTDPHTLAAANEAESEFANEYPNGTQWKDANGKFCLEAFHFNPVTDERQVNVYCFDYNWPNFWFGCVRK